MHWLNGFFFCETFLILQSDEQNLNYLASFFWTYYIIN